MASKKTKRQIKLLIYAGGMVQDMVLDVITGDMSYNNILGRPWLMTRSWMMLAELPG